MLPDRVSNPGPLTYESGALPIALLGPAHLIRIYSVCKLSYFHLWYLKELMILGNIIGQQSAHLHFLSTSHHHHSSSSDFLLTCRYRGHIHNSGPPSRQLACCTHGRSHTRSPGVSIMRVDSWELPLSAISLCQLLPSHLGPPRPTLSINLYVKGCLDCTVGAFHMSIPVEPSLSSPDSYFFFISGLYLSYHLKKWPAVTKTEKENDNTKTLTAEVSYMGLGSLKVRAQLFKASLA